MVRFDTGIEWHFGIPESSPSRLDKAVTQEVLRGNILGTPTGLMNHRVIHTWIKTCSKKLAPLIYEDTQEMLHAIPNFVIDDPVYSEEVLLMLCVKKA